MAEPKSFDAGISIHPKRLRTVAELDRDLAKITLAEEVLGCKCGVAEIVNAQGSYCSITSAEEAAQEMANRGVCDRIEGFYPSSFYRHKRKELLH